MAMVEVKEVIVKSVVLTLDEIEARELANVFDYTLDPSDILYDLYLILKRKGFL